MSKRRTPRGLIASTEAEQNPSCPCQIPTEILQTHSLINLLDWQAAQRKSILESLNDLSVIMNGTRAHIPIDLYPTAKIPSDLLANR